MSNGPLMIDLQGTEISPQERQWLSHSAVGGVILFTRNYQDKEQLTSLVSDLHSIKKPKLLIAVDQEGGRVQRFREGFTAFPPMRCLGEVYDKDPKGGLLLSESLACKLATELREIGIDFTFAPILDLDTGESLVIGDRAFHHDIDAVSALASKFMLGLRKGGMESVGKHFPGHGTVIADSHFECPVDYRYENDLQLADMVPFQRLVDHGIAGIMSAHVVYEHVDKNPASFSKYWLTRVLRDRLKFEGVIFSDDLSMKGAHVIGDIQVRLQAALDAGSDMVLICNSPGDIPPALDHLDNYNNPSSQLRLARFHGKTPEPLTNAQQASLDEFIAAYQTNKSMSLNL
ncbi:MAG: beta-N-acetylhexosaminidase [Gammaproteobacteria bacterium]|nr:beta-N-acetylhexosaminidase [Gammaproteobacteria bacterium]